MPPIQRIAEDLEKLPRELHAPVLADLTFEQLIGLSQFAGPSLTLSFVNSLEPWGPFMRDGDLKQWQSLLKSTSHLLRVCFPRPTSKGRLPWKFESGGLSFLQLRGSDWTDKWTGRHKNIGPKALSYHWLYELNTIIFNSTREVFQYKWSQLIEPWLLVLDPLSEKIEIFLNVKDCYEIPQDFKTKLPLSIQQVALFIQFYEDVRHTRANALAEELRVLADWYEKHPFRLKEPFAPQLPRRNKKHVPSRLQYEAQDLERKATYGGWKQHERRRYCLRQPFPGLVPYEWCTLLFVNVLQSHPLVEAVYPTAIAQKCKSILNDTPPWVSLTSRDALLLQEGAGRVTDVSLVSGMQNLELETHPRMEILTKRSEGGVNAFVPHAQGDLAWLKTFAEVVAWMEEEFPDMVREVRGEAWDDVR